MSTSSLITKARNILVEIHLKSNNRRIAGKIIDFDSEFVEVLVRVNEQTGEFAADRSAFNSNQAGMKDDRVLISLGDISIIA
jgi:hypothetical protein